MDPGALCDLCPGRPVLFSRDQVYPVSAVIGGGGGGIRRITSGGAFVLYNLRAVE